MFIICSVQLMTAVCLWRDCLKLYIYHLSNQYLCESLTRKEHIILCISFPVTFLLLWNPETCFYMVHGYLRFRETSYSKGKELCWILKRFKHLRAVDFKYCISCMNIFVTEYIRNVENKFWINQSRH